MEFIITIQEPEIQLITVASQGEQGIAGLVWIDAGWSSGVDYVVDNALEHNGSSYRVFVAHTSSAANEPGVGVDWETVWKVVAEKGDSGGGIDYANPVSITGAASIPSTDKFKNHVCTGTTTDYTVSLPTTGLTAGDLFSFEMAAALTKMVTLDALAGQLIDGQQTRVMWAGEKAVLKWDGSNWQKVSGLSIPMTFKGYLAADAAGNTQGTFNKVNIDTIVYDNGSMFSAGSFILRRSAKWNVASRFPVKTDSAAEPIFRCICRGYINSVPDETFGDVWPDISNNVAATPVRTTGAVSFNMTVGDILELYIYSAVVLSVTNTFTILSGATLGAELTGTEVVEW